MKHHILLVDDDLAFRKAMSDFLKDEGFLVTAIESGDEAIALVRQDVAKFSLALVDYHMPMLSGLETIKALKSLDAEMTIFTFSGDDSEEAFNKSLESGAVFFIEKDISNQKLLGLLHRVCTDLDRRTKVATVISDHSENQKIITQIGMVGVSNSMAEIAKLIMKFAPHNDAVLIRGENGTGKEKVARAIHNHSLRVKQPFIAVNCAAIPENLIESELFGYEKGAFTGASKNKKGHFEAAHGGTLFLDEIGDLPKHLQAKLLRVLQDKTITPVGSVESKKIDFRLVTATNAPLEKMIEQGLFREDLYFRLNVLPIMLSPLRNRPEDIPILALYFLNKANLESQQSKKILESSLDELKKLKWSGNIRELEHAIRFLSTMAVDEYLDVGLLAKSNRVYEGIEKSLDLHSLKSTHIADEKNILKKALEEGGSISEASRILNLKRTTLRDKMKKYKIGFDKITTGEIANET